MNEWHHAKNYAYYEECKLTLEQCGDLGTQTPYAVKNLRITFDSSKIKLVPGPRFDTKICKCSSILYKMAYIIAYSPPSSSQTPNCRSKAVQVFNEKKNLCKWTHAVQTQAIQGSTVLFLPNQK